MRLPIGALVGALAVSAVAIGGMAGPASATEPLKTGCPGGFQLVSEQFVLAVADPAFVDAIKAMDANNDDLLCYKLLPEPIPLFEPTFLFYDNKFPAV